ncbi:synaptotagmin-12-like isoform X1 [Limulus polyphemus]|uniref:Synaptotagmin-12-like isoform X1 n=2 Tax=Limulus polyphemus TaxID=6850 RepID=A0ABM1BRA9_LIMPO|nr:synaptotagmin-12-like isoform X1 [Limulus polyphemus]
MTDLDVAITLTGISIIIAAILYGLCRLLGGWTWLRTWLTGTKEETAHLTKSEDFGMKGYSNMVESESDLALDVSGNYKHYDNVTNDVKMVDEIKPTEDKTDSIPLMHRPRTKPCQPSTPEPSDIQAPPTEKNIRQPSSGSERQNSLESFLPDVLDFDNSSTKLQRAISCDSVSSDTSVVLETMESPQNNGELEIGFEYDSETEDLIVIVNQARDLVGPNPNVAVDSYVRVFLLPDKTTNMQTRVQRRTNDPIFKERFLFGVDSRELSQRSVLCYVYTSDKYTNTLIGETEIKLIDIDLTKPHLRWMPIIDSNQKPTDLGDVMFSLSYLPTAERLTVVMVKARNIKFPAGQETGSPFVKVYLLQNGKKISKKKTSIKKDDKNPIFNEAMIFSVPTNALQQNIQLRMTVADYHGDGKAPSLGHVFVGSQCRGKSLSHWNQMMSSLRKPIAMWHPLRK